MNAGVFNSPLRLNNHCVSTHDTRHFGCTYCMKDFKSNLEACAHLREHQIECFLCTEMFLTEEDYNQHMSEEHQDNPLTIDEMRSEEDKKDLEKCQREKMEKQECRAAYHANIEKEKKQIKGERKRKAQPDTGESSPKKKKKCKAKDNWNDEVDPDNDDDDDEQDDQVTPDDKTKDPDYKPPREDDDDEDEDDDDNKEPKELVE